MISKCEECGQSIQYCRSRSFITMQHKEHASEEEYNRGYFEPGVVEEFGFCDVKCLRAYLNRGEK
jgi:hypothetical protein